MILEFEFQQKLSKMQAYPVVGPIFVSPAKAVCAVIQTIISLTAAVFLGLLAIVFVNVRPYAGIAFLYAGTGLIGLGYSVVNILSLGYIGYKIERPCTSTYNVSSYNNALPRLRDGMLNK